MARLLLCGRSHEMLALARRLGHEVCAVADPGWTGGAWHGLTVHASDDQALAAGGFDAAAMAIDDPELRRRVQTRFAAAGVPAADLIGGMLGTDTVHGAGLVLQHLSHLSVDGRVGEGVRLNVGANVMHEARLGDYVTLAPNAVVLGRVTIGSLTYVGASATVLPGVVIGARCVIGAGAVVTRDVQDGQTVKGNPAR
jgi:sugar O-acyltransferase (sialic acid O-acetyltransferase NeuD family)